MLAGLGFRLESRHRLGRLCGFLDQRPGPRLANLAPKPGGLGAKFVFNRMKGSGAGQGAGCVGEGVDGMDPIALAPGMCPAGDLVNSAANRHTQIENTRRMSNQFVSEKKNPAVYAIAFFITRSRPCIERFVVCS